MKPNVPDWEQCRIERKFRKLLYKFFVARGDARQRHLLVKKMKRLRETACIVWEQFIEWFQTTLSIFSAAEHERVLAEFMPKYRHAIVLLESSRCSRPMSSLLH